MTETAEQNSQEELGYVRAMLSGIVFECPLGIDFEDCLCRDIRKLPAHERFEWVKQLSAKECFAIYNQHLRCLQKKKDGVTPGSTDSPEDAGE